ncbi:hypothetical protein PPERSA_08670 [Pseudocohnilembus persalinus]|uniref:Uncharacterized protein n=1 Tax=Pseudocohnilembus persalinus TaxID=266149 RepID=A0A0V0R873_PSEPJ|nr:hypothetical protein PPERSA_08670 [Pseudocohnilembus persalinus]|eukprot:KRX10675.1 hypothetical protein PPERSA_08670 [Pseudocohnilembus persalinus]
MLGSQPFHLMNDGYLLIVKDKNKQPKELSNEELQKMGVTLLSGKGNKSLQMQKMRQQGQSKQGGRQPNLEKELSITVKKKASNKQLQQLENANQKNEEIAQQEQIDGENLDQKQEKNDKFLEQEEKKQNNLNTEKD